MDQDNLEFRARWEMARKRYLVETPDTCLRCKLNYKTGDIVFVFGELEVVIVRTVFLCDACGYDRILSSGGSMIPTATLIFIESEHRVQRLTELPVTIAERVEESFGIVDRIHAHVSKLAERMPEPSSGQA